MIIQITEQEQQLNKLVSIIKEDGKVSYYRMQWHVDNTIPIMFIISLLILFLLFIKEIEKKWIVITTSVCCLIISTLLSMIILDCRYYAKRKMDNPVNHIYNSCQLNN